MIGEIGQAATEAARTGGTVFTGSFVLDGAILIAALKVVEAVVNKIRVKTNGKKPHPAPGESETCREHGEAIASLNAFQTSANASLVRIETKVDRILERGGK